MATVAAGPTFTNPQTNTSSHPYTCNTCQVAFKGSELQRTHMQSDWHRYNLKRRIASLPPLTSEIFAEKVLANQASAAATAARASFERVCGLCQRTYFSENAYQNHLGSQKHRARLAQLANSRDAETETDTASMTSSAFSLGDPIKNDDTRSDRSTTPTGLSKIVDGVRKTESSDVEISTGAVSEEHSKSETSSTTLQCLFCNFNSATIDDNVLHMQSSHGMFIPERSYLVDMEGLLEYLFARVHELHECLYCGQVKHTNLGIQTHMRDKGHCKIAFESEEEMIEVGEFYDFRGSYSDSDGDSDRDGVEQDADDDEWEDEDDVEDTEMADGKTDADSKMKQSRNHAYQVDDELHLPSGRTAGHRSLAKYFRQNLREYPSVAEREVQRLKIANGEVSTEEDGLSNSNRSLIRGRGRELITRENGGLGLLGASDLKKREAQSAELKDRRRQQRQQARFQWGNERRANNQKHFRDPLLQ